MSYAVVRTDNMTGTDVRSQLVSVKYMGSDGSVATEIENGNVLKIGDLVSGESEVYVGTDTAADSAISEVVLIATEEIVYDDTKKNLSDFINEADSICRGYRLNAGDIFSVTAEALEGTPEVGSAVTLGAGTKLVVGGSGTSVGKIIAEDITSRYTYYAIRVI